MPAQQPEPAETDDWEGSPSPLGRIQAELSTSNRIFGKSPHLRVIDKLVVERRISLELRMFRPCAETKKLQREPGKGTVREWQQFAFW